MSAIDVPVEAPAAAPAPAVPAPDATAASKQAPTDFAALGVQFITIQSNDHQLIDQCLHFLWTEFAPNATLMRNLGITRNWVMDHIKFKECLKSGASIAALDRNGAVIGIRLGKVVKRKNWAGWLKDKVFKRMLPHITWVLPSGMRNYAVYSKIFKNLKFDIWAMFDQYGCDTIYAANGLCSVRSSGVRGLGTELVKRSEDLAKELGCQIVAAIVTGIYSERVFKNLGYLTLAELHYDNFRDESGELYLKDTREHKKCFTCWKDLRNLEEVPVIDSQEVVIAVPVLAAEPEAVVLLDPKDVNVNVPDVNVNLPDVNVNLLDVNVNLIDNCSSPYPA